MRVKTAPFFNLLKNLVVVVASVALFPVGYAFCAPTEVCMYVSVEGKVVQVNSISKVPEELRKQAKCFAVKAGEYLAPPEEVQLRGNRREQVMNSSLGRIRLRWQRKSEELFGRTPERAMADAARTVSKALKRGGFPLSVQGIDLEWNVVFMDEEVPDAQIPQYLVSNCHPAWMTPPANLYVVAQRVAAGCTGDRNSGSSNADAQLAHVLIHEMGHAIEYQLLGALFGRDRQRSEGFASWFEQYASDFSMIIPKGFVKDTYFGIARDAFRGGIYISDFSGSSEDYAKASMYFNAIVERRGVKGLMDVYEVMTESKMDFFPAVQAELGWDQDDFAREIQKLL